MSAQWMTLAVGALTAVMTLAGVLLTQWQSGKREAARSQLETEHERLRQAREDAARIFDHRRDHYLEFLSVVESHRASWRDFQERTGWQEHAPDGVLENLENQLWRVRIYGTSATAEVAERVYRWMERDMFNGDAVDADHASGFDRLIGELVERIRSDLGVTNELMPSVRAP